MISKTAHRVQSPSLCLHAPRATHHTKWLFGGTSTLQASTEHFYWARKSKALTLSPIGHLLWVKASGFSTVRRLY